MSTTDAISLIDTLAGISALLICMRLRVQLRRLREHVDTLCAGLVPPPVPEKEPTVPRIRRVSGVPDDG